MAGRRQIKKEDGPNRRVGLCACNARVGDEYRRELASPTMARRPRRGPGTVSSQKNRVFKRYLKFKATSNPPGYVYPELNAPNECSMP